MNTILSQRLYVDLEFRVPLRGYLSSLARDLGEVMVYFRVSCDFSFRVFVQSFPYCHSI